MSVKNKITPSSKKGSKKNKSSENKQKNKTTGNRNEIIKNEAAMEGGNDVMIHALLNSDISDERKPD